jgi:hypothetical protein
VPSDGKLDLPIRPTFTVQITFGPQETPDESADRWASASSAQGVRLRCQHADRLLPRRGVMRWAPHVGEWPGQCAALAKGSSANAGADHCQVLMWSMSMFLTD